jgi:LPS sulfotransferase NodH
MTTDDSDDPARKFVVLTSQRTGSTLLVRSLDSSPLILCAGEIFHTGEGIQHLKYRFPHKFIGSILLGKLRNTFFGRSRVRRHLNRFYASGGSGVRAVGFKLMISQARQLPPIIPELMRLRAHFLVLYRDDSIAAALSYCRAKATSMYHSDRVGSDRQRADVTVSEEEFRRTLDKCRRDKAQLVQWGSAHGAYLMRYEDMDAHWVDFVDRVGQQLGISGLRIPMALRKLAADENGLRIANEAELRANHRDLG